MKSAGEHRTLAASVFWLVAFGNLRSQIPELREERVENGIRLA
jgi:hypothetical protein